MSKRISTWRGSRGLLALIALALVGCAAISTRSYKDLKYPPLGEVQIPSIERVELDNGMILYLVEDHEFPTIDLRARIRTGSMYDPADKIGLAGITGQVMRTGGTTSIPGDELDEILEGMAASVETWIGATEGGASMSLMKGDLDKGLDILADVLMHPAFPEDKIKLAKIQAKSQISRRNDDPWSITSREFNKLIYGPDHPYARHTEYATIDAIAREDMTAFHRKYFHPNNVIMAVWGDFDTEEMKEKISRAFADWKPEETAFPPVPEIVRDRPPSVNYIYKEDVNQTNIFIGHLGVRADDPNYHALILLQEILGGGFTSRLFKEVRSNLGLAYAVWATSGVGFHHPGVFYAGCSTKSASTHAALDAMMAQLKRITEEEVTNEELELAKERIRNSYVFKFDTKGEIVERKVFYEFYGYPTDFLEKYREGIEKVTQADILEAAKARIHPDRFTILAVGRAQDFDRPLDDLGPVNTIDMFNS
ncbi:TPA: insulinase family protein [Candidatus Poribacteria bacterium]|nr:insulinase family protein [Candidatus Poribacteria bacterium]